MIWLDLLIALSCGGAGLACGWVMHAMNGISSQSTIAHTQSVNAPAPVVDRADSLENAQDDRQRISEAAERLKSYAYSMAADVDAHQSKVQAVNNSLNENADSSPEAVSEAIHQLIEANEAMQAQLQSAQDRIHEQALQIESAEKRAETDALTRVPNRGALDRHLAQRHELGSGAVSTLAMLDVDHFKKFNDVYGHRAGDEVLRIVAGMLHSRLNDRGIVARFGGEEFAMVLDDCDIQTASQYVEEARQAISQREILFEDKRLRVTASVGLAQLTTDESGQCESLEQWIQRSDDGLYHSKEAGRDCGHWMDGTTPVKIELQKASKTEIRRSQKSDTSAASASPEAAEPASGPFASLPNRKAMSGEFSEMQERAGASVTTLFNASTLRSLLQVVRATLRNVDRLGYQDQSTLLVCMPSVDQETARTRGEQICRSAASIGLRNDEGESRAISIGVAEIDTGEEFDQVVDRSVTMADQGRDPSRDVVIFDSESVNA
jgi:diguanylate cyclase (GGDEF)-like protein